MSDAMKQHLRSLFDECPLDGSLEEYEAGLDNLFWRRIANKYGLLGGDECNPAETDIICETMKPDAHTIPGCAPDDDDYKPAVRLQRGEDAFLVILALQSLRGDTKGRYPAWQRFGASLLYHDILQSQMVPHLPAEVLKELKVIGRRSAERRRRHWESLGD